MGVVNAADLGDRLDKQFSDIHSRNKSILATRAAVLALRQLYGRSDLVAYGPQPDAVLWPAGTPAQFEVRLMFNTSGGGQASGLYLGGTAECRNCCSLAGSPVQFVLSNKTIVRAVVGLDTARNGSGSVLRASTVLGAGVRVLDLWFNYEAYPECALYNEGGIPALPFALAHPQKTSGDEVRATVQSLIGGSPAIPPNWIGFSLEWNIATSSVTQRTRNFELRVRVVLNDSPLRCAARVAPVVFLLLLSWTGVAQPRRSFIRLMQQLMQTPNQAGPTFRIGGDSATHSWYNPDHSPLPPIPYASGDYNITNTTLLALVAGAAAVNGTLVMGLNFRLAADASWAVRHVQAVRELLGGWGVVSAFEIGNEPDLLSPKYRPANWTMSDYYHEFDFYTSAIRKAVPSLPQRFFQGAAYASVASWLTALPQYVARFQPLLINVAHHSYSGCADAIPPPTMEDQLSDKAALKHRVLLTNGSDDALARVKQLGTDLICGEGNSVCHSGQPNVSNAFGVALWMLDSAFNVASIGLQHFFWHAHDRRHRTTRRWYGKATTATYRPFSRSTTD